MGPGNEARWRPGNEACIKSGTTDLVAGSSLDHMIHNFPLPSPRGIGYGPLVSLVPSSLTTL